MRAASPVSNEQIIAKLVERGAPAEQVAKIKAIMEGRPLNAERRELADFRRAEIIRMNAEGMHDGAIASELGIARAYVCKVRNALGIPPVKRRP